MSDYTKTVDFAAKDSLPSGNSGKIIKGTEFETEFDNIATAIATKANSAGPTFTGVLTFASFKGATGATVTTILDEDDMATNSDTALATQQSIKAYVDAQQDTVDTFAEILALSNTTGGTDLAVSTGDDITFADSSKAIFGAGSDLQIYHDGSNSIIYEGGTGDLQLRGNGGNTTIMNGGGTETLANFGNNGAVTLYYDNAVKLATTTTGIDVTGTVTADGLTVDTSATGGLKVENRSASSGTSITSYQGTTNANVRQLDLNAYKVSISTGAVTGTAVSERLLISDIGDISFYEDTGTTAKFVWDASAESLGIGTSTPSEKLTIQSGNLNFMGGTNDAQYIKFGDTGDDDIGNIFYYHGNNNMVFTTNASEAMRIDSSGNVGIGSGTAYSPLSILNGADISMGAGATGQFNITGNAYGFGIALDGTGAHLYTNSASRPLIFGTNETERMRLDGSGNLLVGATTANQAGITLRGDSDYIYVARNGGVTSYFDRQSTDGAITEFRKDGTTVGSISTRASGLVVGSGDTGLFYDGGGDRIFPESPSGGAARDAAIDLGTSAARFKDLHLSGVSYNGDGSATAPSITFGADTNTGFYRVGSDKIGFVTAGTLRAMIDNSGNVGIGTSAPAYLMHLEDSNGADLALGNSTVSPSAGDYLGRIYALDSGDNFFAGVNMFYHDANDGEMRFRVKTAGTNADVMTLVDGSVGIGTSLPARKLEISGGHARLSDGYNLEWGGGTNYIRGSNASNYVFVATNSTERMRIDSSGNVGIGSSVPDKLLVVQGASAEVVISDTSNAPLLRFRESGVTKGTISTSSGALIFDSGGDTERLRIDASGNLLVGITDVVAAGSDGVQIHGAAGYISSGRNTTSGASHHIFYNPNGIVGNIETGGSATTYNTSSDQRLKENIADAPSASEDIDAIQVRSFDWKADGEHQKYGMVAQELLEVAPSAVSAPEDPDKMMGVDYSKLVPMMLKEIQSLRARVAQLES